jgi:hypothetical protein
MKTYEVTGTYVSVNSGTLRLKPEQAAARAHALKETGKHLFEVLSPVGFKRGEVFGYDGQINKALLSEVAETGKKAEGKKAGAAAAAPARSGIAAMLGGKKATAVAEPEEQEADAPAKQEETAA